MGQRGYRKRRTRCEYVDRRTGLRCRQQVKKAGNRFCCQQHAALARPAARVTEPGARARYRQAREKDAARLLTQLRMVADEMGRVSVMAVLPIAMTIADQRYVRGYTAGRAKTRDSVRKLRLLESRNALDEFLGSRFGKAFATGELKPADLAKFKFGGKRDGRLG